MSTTSEQAVAVVRASVMIYDDGGKRWVPAGQSGQPAESKVQLFQHLRVSTYRIVARKGPDHEVVLNCPLYGSMKYNQTTATFHQWRTEQRQLYGLNFVSQDDAQVFGQAVLRAVEALGLATNAGSGAQQQMASQNGNYDHHHQHNGLPGVASAPALLRQQQPQSGIYQQQGQHFIPHAASAGEYCPQPQQVSHQQRISQDDAQQFHPNSVYQQQLSNEAYYGVSPALHLQKHQRQPSAGSNASSSGSSGTTSQTSNLIYSTVTPTNVVPSPSRPAPPVPPPPPPPTPPASSKVPPAPPAPTGSVPPAPPPPPPPVPNGTSASNSMPKQPINLAQAISNQKLRKVPSGAAQARSTAMSDEPGINKDARSASVGSVDATISTARGGIGGGSHFDVMSEMAATLARRRLMAESGTATSSGTLSNGVDTAASDSPTRVNEKGPETKQKPWESRNGSRPSLNDAPSSNTDSPKTHRKVPSGSSLSSQEDVGLSLMGGGAGAPAAIGQTSRSLSNGPTSAATPVVVSADTLEQWKQEILNEVKREINKAKADIIEALKLELNRR